jgi:hypothetical protein
LGSEFGWGWGSEGKEWGGEEEGKKEFFHGLGFVQGWGNGWTGWGFLVRWGGSF